MAAWGVLSGKFVIATSGLLFSASVDRHRTEAVIDPSLATSSISVAMASKLHLDPSGRRRVSIGVGAEEFDAPALSIAANSLPLGVGLVIGKDILDSHVFDIDPKRMELSLVESRDVKLLAKSAVAVPVDATSLAVQVAPEDGPPFEVALDLTEVHDLNLGPRLPQEPAPTMRIGSILLVTNDVEYTYRPDGSLEGSVGIAAFGHHHLLLDLGHGKMWIGRTRE